MNYTSAFLKIITLLLSCFSYHASIAQDMMVLNPPKIKKFVTIYSLQSFQKAEVQLYEFTPDAIYAIPKEPNERVLFQLPATSEIYKFSVENIQKITYKKKDFNIGNALLGCVIGFATGYAVGVITGESRSNFWVSDSQTNVLLGGLFGTIGAGIGSKIGLKTTITINGNQEKYDCQDV